MSHAKLPALRINYTERLGHVCALHILDDVAAEAYPPDTDIGWKHVIVHGLPFEQIAKSYKVLWYSIGACADDAHVGF